MTNFSDLPLWLNMYQLRAWVQYRDLGVVSRSSDYDGLAAQMIYGKESLVGRSGDLENALQSGKLVAHGTVAGAAFAPIAPIEWTRIPLTPPGDGSHGPYDRIQVKREDALALFPAVKVARASHSDVVEWCQSWIDEGKGSGMDKAWPSFRNVPQHAGLSRDNFREAWTEAKGRKRPAR